MRNLPIDILPNGKQNFEMTVQLKKSGSKTTVTKTSLI